MCVCVCVCVCREFGGPEGDWRGAKQVRYCANIVATTSTLSPGKQPVLCYILYSVDKGCLLPIIIPYICKV